MSAEPPALRIHNLSRRFGAVTAVDSVSLEVLPGELVSILGPSGCGKSTLLQLIAGHVSADSGTISIGGREVVSATGSVPARDRSVGMVFQEYALFPHLTVAQNVEFALPKLARFAARSAKAHRAQRTTALLELMEIAPLADRKPGQLSGGQQQRVAIARALAQEPELLLLDEPFCNLDASMREHVRGEIVALLRRTNLTCVFVTHDQEEALAVSDKVAVMQQGRIAQVDAPEILYRRPFCLEVAEFLGRTNIMRGRAEGSQVHTKVGTFQLLPDAHGDVQVVVRPELLDVVADPAGTTLVLGREFRGHDAVYTLALEGGRIVHAHRPSVGMVNVGDKVRIVAQPGYAAIIQPDSAPAPSDVDAEAAARSAASAGLINNA